MPRKPKNLFIDRTSPILRETALPVLAKDIGSSKLTTIITKMKKALHGEDDGVAIAAPQIGESLRLFVVKGDIFAMERENGEVDKEKEIEDRVFINPEITKVSKKKKDMEEGCLSLRYLYGHVSRHEKATLKALDENGKPVTIGASGLLAQIFQHEVDHLNGILFTDKAENVRDLPPKDE